MRQASSCWLIDVPDMLVDSGASPSSSSPTTYAVAATTTTVISTNAITATSLANSSRTRPTGRTSR